jgi:hypothetical protein
LSTLITEGQERQEKAEAERQSFAESRDARDEIQSYYSEQGDLSATLDAYIAWAKAFAENPQEAGLAWVEKFMPVSKYGLKPRVKSEPVEAEVIDGRRYSGRKLNAIIDDAQRAGDERKTFEATARQREELNRLMPGKTFAEQMRTIAEINRDSIIDPYAVGAQLATTFGMPVTPGQQQAHANKKHAEAMVERATQRLPGFEQLTPAITGVLNDERFQRTGDHATDLQNAYSVAIHQHKENLWTAQQLGAIEKDDPTFARAVADTILKDSAFKKHVATMGPDLVGRFHAAIAWARAKTQSDQRAVSKAQRVRPVKSSSGALASQLGGGLDGHLSAAMRDWK